MKNLLSKEIYKRTDKIGFETPIESKLLSHRGSMHKIVKKYINDSKLDEFGVDINLMNKNNNSKWFYFSLLSLSMFKNKFFS